MGAMASKYELSEKVNLHFPSSTCFDDAHSRTINILNVILRDSCVFFPYRNRKKIAKYKAAAALAHKSEVEELRVISQLRDDDPSTTSPERQLQGTKASPSNGKMSELKAGNIMVTWKDGNTSCLYSDAAADAELSEEAEAVEEKQEVSAA